MSTGHVCINVQDEEWCLDGKLYTSLLDFAFVGLDRAQPGHAAHIFLTYEYIPGQ